MKNEKKFTWGADLNNKKSSGALNPHGASNPGEPKSGQPKKLVQFPNDLTKNPNLINLPPAVACMKQYERRSPPEKKLFLSKPS